MSAIPYVSNRLAMKRFLGMTEEEIAENERLWREENDEALSMAPVDASGELRSEGVSGAGIEGDLGGIEDEVADTEAVAGGDTTPPDTTTGDSISPVGAQTEQTV